MLHRPPGSMTDAADEKLDEGAGRGLLEKIEVYRRATSRRCGRGTDQPRTIGFVLNASVSSSVSGSVSSSVTVSGDERYTGAKCS